MTQLGFDREALAAIVRRATLAVWKCGAAIAEGLIVLDLAGIRRHIHKGKHGIMPARPLAKGTDLFNAPHVYLALLGKFQGRNRR